MPMLSLVLLATAIGIFADGAFWEGSPTRMFRIAGEMLVT